MIRALNLSGEFTKALEGSKKAPTPPPPLSTPKDLRENLGLI